MRCKCGNKLHFEWVHLAAEKIYDHRINSSRSRQDLICKCGSCGLYQKFNHETKSWYTLPNLCHKYEATRNYSKLCIDVKDHEGECFIGRAQQ